MNAIYFDGTISSAGNLLAACDVVDARVFVVTHRCPSENDDRFLRQLADCGGSIGSFNNGRFVPHRRMGSARHCAAIVDDGVEAFFAKIVDRTDEEVEEWLRLLNWCHRGNCGRCAACAHVVKTAEAYGFYDVASLVERHL